jgi:hypothetical protein
MSTLTVHGPATPEDVAAVLAVLSRGRNDDAPADTGYERWRATRRRALRTGAEPVDRPV